MFDDILGARNTEEKIKKDPWNNVDRNPCGSKDAKLSDDGHEVELDDELKTNDDECECDDDECSGLGSCGNCHEDDENDEDDEDDEDDEWNTDENDI